MPAEAGGQAGADVPTEAGGHAGADVPAEAGGQAGGTENGQADAAAPSDNGEAADVPQEPAVETSGGVVTEGIPEKAEGSEAPDAAENNGSNGIYIVEQGDTLAIISQKLYGDISHVDAISRMNGLTDGNLIYIGQKLLLP